MELLHKSFEEFVEEFQALYDTNYAHDAIYDIYQEHDRQRLSEYTGQYRAITDSYYLSPGMDELFSRRQDDGYPTFRHMQDGGYPGV